MTAAPATGSPRGRLLARRIATAVSGLAVLAAVAGLAVAGEVWPPPETRTVEARTVEVPAGPVAQVCPGPPVLATAVAGEDLDYDEFDPDGSGTSTLVQVMTLPRDGGPAAPGRWAGSLDLADAADLAPTGEVRAHTGTDIGGPSVLEAEPVEGRAALTSGTSLSRTDAGDLRGLFAAPCVAPATTSWLVGGSTEPGSSARLVLANLGDTPATVEVSAWGSTGPLDTASASNVLVPAHAQKVVLLEAVTGADPRLAVRVQASGGEVGAYVQDAQLRGLVPAGVAAIVPGAEPAPTVHIPGVELVESDLTDADPAAVRIVNPGDDVATLSVTLLGPDGEVEVPGADDLVVDPGSVAEVSLAGLPAGVWTVEVASDEPVTAGALLTRVGTPGEEDAQAPLDRAWVPATQPHAGGVVVVPGLGERIDTATLALANPGGQDREVTLRPVTADGESAAAVSVTVPARSSTAHDIAGLAGAEVAAVQVDAEADAPVHAAVVLSADGGDGTLIGVVPLTEDPDDAQSVAVGRGAPGLR